MTTVSETLNKAADLIETRGWCAGGGGQFGRICVEQAIVIAETGKCENGEYIGSSYSNPATMALRSYLDLRGSVWAWNDELPYLPDYTYVGGSRASADQHGQERRAVAALRAAAVIEESRESAIIAAANALDAPVVVGARA